MSSYAIFTGVLTAVSTATQLYAEHQEAKFEAKQDEANAEILRKNAYRKRLEASINEDTQRRENRQTIARNLAASIEQGNGGSNTMVGALGQQSTILEQNALNLRYEGLSSSDQLLTQANYYDYSAQETRRQAKNNFNLGMINAGAQMGLGYLQNREIENMNKGTSALKKTKYKTKSGMYEVTDII